MTGERVELKYCDNCRHLGLTEDKQDEFRRLKSGFPPNHFCRKYQCQVLHLNRHPHIVRAGVCLDGDGFEAV